VADGGKSGRSDDYYIERMTQGFRLARQVVFVLGIVALYVPIHAVVPVAHELAGKDTDLTASFSISIVISLGSLAGVLTTWLKTRGQGAELQRLRGQVEVYEKQ
jgi:hypothetical protein